MKLFGKKKRIAFGEPCDLTREDAAVVVRHDGRETLVAWLEAAPGIGLVHASDERHAINLARQRIRVAHGILREPLDVPRHLRPVGEDIDRALVALGCSRALCGLPRVWVKAGNQIVQWWTPDAIVSTPELECLAAAVGVSLAELEAAAGITAAREMHERVAEIDAAHERRADAEHRQELATRRAEAAKRRAAYVAEKAAEAEREAQAAAQAADRTRAALPPTGDAA